ETRLLRAQAIDYMYRQYLGDPDRYRWANPRCAALLKMCSCIQCSKYARALFADPDEPKRGGRRPGDGDGKDAIDRLIPVCRNLGSYLNDPNTGPALRETLRSAQGWKDSELFALQLTAVEYKR